MERKEGKIWESVTRKWVQKTTIQAQKSNAWELNIIITLLCKFVEVHYRAMIKQQRSMHLQ